MRYLFFSFHSFLLTLSTLQSQTIWYVNANNSSGAATGTSWQTAFPQLQSALHAAQYGDEIWVAAGLYTPTATTQRDLSFELKSGVKLLGGFNGTESTASERNPELNLSRLSGNIGDTALMTDNAYHVLLGKGLDENTVLDGFTISDGYSDVNFGTNQDQFGAGMFLLGGAGLTDSRPLITHCIFEHNQAGQGGGGIFIGDIDPTDPFGPQYLVNPRIRDCAFVQNRGNYSGGGLMKSGPTTPNDTFLLENCQFIDNYAFTSHGAGMFVEKTGSSSIAFRNCIFERNETQGGDGGGLNVTANSEGPFTISVTMESCTFYKNRAPAGGGFYVDGLYFDPVDYTINLHIQNCIFEENDGRSETGGAYTVYIGKNGIVQAEIRNCRFLRNVANSYFATAFICNDESEANVLVEECEFIGNRQRTNPNAYFVAYSAGGYKVHSRLNNCLFAQNSGGAIFAGSPEKTYVLTEVTNCTFFHNGANPFGKRWYTSFNQTGAQYYNKMNFLNCAIWEPQSNHRLIYNNDPDILNGSWFFFDYCSISPLVPSPAIIPNHSVVFGDSIDHSVYPGFLDTLSGDFRLGACAPVMNRGSNEAVEAASIVSDFDGLNRIRFDRVDLGAYELQDSCGISGAKELDQSFSGILHPNPAAPGSLVHWEYPESESEDLRWQLRDAYGRLLSTGTGTEMRAPHSSGIYGVDLYYGQRSAHVKLLVQR